MILSLIHLINCTSAKDLNALQKNINGNNHRKRLCHSKKYKITFSNRKQIVVSWMTRTEIAGKPILRQL